MIWAIIIAVVVFVLFKFSSALNKDNGDLAGQSLSEKFSFVVNILNDNAYGGEGKVTTIDKRRFNLYQENSNQIIQFQYSTGSLTICWKYKYYQKEIIHEKTFDEVRNLSLFEQEKIANILIREMKQVIAYHKTDVLSF